MVVLLFDGLFKDTDVFVDNEVGGCSARAGMANLGQLPVRRPSDEIAVADGGVKRDDVLAIAEADGASERDGRPSEVEQAPVATAVLRDGDE
jgi:hypothetical protein